MLLLLLMLDATAVHAKAPRTVSVVVHYSESDKRSYSHKLKAGEKKEIKIGIPEVLCYVMAKDADMVDMFCTPQSLPRFVTFAVRVTCKRDVESMEVYDSPRTGDINATNSSRRVIIVGCE